MIPNSTSLSMSDANVNNSIQYIVIFGTSHLLRRSGCIISDYTVHMMYTLAVALLVLHFPSPGYCMRCRRYLVTSWRADCSTSHPIASGRPSNWSGQPINVHEHQVTTTTITLATITMTTCITLTCVGVLLQSDQG